MYGLIGRCALLMLFPGDVDHASFRAQRSSPIFRRGGILHVMLVEIHLRGEHIKCNLWHDWEKKVTEMRVLFLSFSWGFQDFFADSLGLSGPEILISSLNWEGLVNDGISPKVYEFEQCRNRTRWFIYFFSALLEVDVFFSHCFLGVKKVTSG